MDDIKILKGNIIYTKTKDTFEICEHSYLVCKDGKVEGIYQTLPFRLGGEPIEDHGDCLIIPGMTDLHIHAPQYTFRGTGMDLELLEWLETNTFSEEAKYKDVLYANEAYAKFAENLKQSSTTRACVFGTIHRRPTLVLMDHLERSGLVTMVGKVNMDRNSPDELREGTQESAEETVEWMKDVQHKKYKNTLPILTPRFIPSCTDELLDMLKMVQMRYQIPVQSHLSENLSEIEWVKELCPYAEFYGDAYDHFGLFGADAPTVMAHCVYSTEEEIQRISHHLGNFFINSRLINILCFLCLHILYIDNIRILIPIFSFPQNLPIRLTPHTGHHTSTHQNQHCCQCSDYKLAFLLFADDFFMPLVVFVILNLIEKLFFHLIRHCNVIQ